ncbi:MAG TPA: metallophosphoesterase, partial [Gemmataceae bacterium]|nr:metallophosphoesterase [Gemmataceae bacterium]
MRILHTADWHLGDRLGRIDRTHDLRRAVERVGDYCRHEKVDVLLVAGDLFSELARPDSLREAIEHWQTVFRDFLASGGTILTLTGNHDNENFCRTLTHAMNLAAPIAGEVGEVLPAGRLYLATEPTLLRLRDRR